MALTARRSVNAKGNSHQVTGNTYVDGGSVSTIYFGALLEQNGANGAIPYVDGDAFAGIALRESTTTSENIPVYTSVEISGLAIAGTPVVGAAVYSTSDDIGDLTQTAGTNKVGTITEFDGTTYTVWFRTGL